MISRYKRIKLKNGSTRDEHRLIMEKYLDRKLDRCEIVHHCDENPQNNKIENLELMLLSVHGRLHHPRTSLKFHGTVARYCRGCRCHDCKKAKNFYLIQYRKNKL